MEAPLSPGIDKVKGRLAGPWSAGEKSRCPACHRRRGGHLEDPMTHDAAPKHLRVQWAADEAYRSGLTLGDGLSRML
jgi:hypothetical protein